jgi:hypothetical protein
LEQLDRHLLWELTRLGEIEVGVVVAEDPRGKIRRFISRRPGARELSGCGDDVKLFVLPALSTLIEAQPE